MREQEPQHAEIEEVKNYWNDYVIGIEVSDKKVGSDAFFEELEAYYQKKYDQTISHVQYGAYTGKKLLEIGCGWGMDLIQYAMRGAKVSGVDLSPNAIALAKQYFKYRGVEGTIETGNAESLRFDDKSFDVVVSLGVLHHTPNTQKAIDEVYRVLKPGGEALIMLYNKYSWYKLLSLVSGTNIENEEKDPPIIKTYSLAEVHKMFSKFETVHIEVICFPTRTDKRSGIFASLYNSIFVPTFNLIPKALTKKFGWHILIKASKASVS